jgi:hypothetical protein
MNLTGLVRRGRRNGFLALGAALLTAALALLPAGPAMAMKPHFTKAEMCQVIYPCEPPVNYRSGPFLAPPHIVAVTMPRIQAICGGGEERAARGSAFPYDIMACAQVTPTSCVIHISNGLRAASPELYALVLAHELGHCRGWVHP